MAKNTSNNGKQSARQISAQMRQDAARREKRFRLISIGVLVAAVLGLAIAAVPIVKGYLDEKNKATPTLADVTRPTVVNTEGGITVGAEGVAGTTGGADAVEVATYVDYMCPACGAFEDATVAQMDQLREAGLITLVVQPVSILNRFSQGSEYSTRAAAAAVYVAANAPEQFLAFHTALFGNQPAENTKGLTNKEIGAIALTAGVPSEVSDAIASDKAEDEYADWIDAQTADIVERPELLGEQGFSTPTVTIDGKRWDGNWTVEGALVQAVNEAAGTTEG
ncbi:protein-disulfide isomerase [Flavimobilis soli]|uniref:Protein-disulfide isomerase n=1 Tax=Flavimobilis soli TaxID=442709 RepID=A0A2A9EFF7_9MICO|nr:thioredoxin domain-containing protein [Flavimobilis soli]PFG37356.1 protein-disulfide isomerase [Flavimobilis soli]